MNGVIALASAEIQSTNVCMISNARSTNTALTRASVSLSNTAAEIGDVILANDAARQVIVSQKLPRVRTT